MLITLKNLPQATEQEIFDKVALHLLKQNVKSTRKGTISNSICAYRSKNGKDRCAAGCLIADDEYDPDQMEYHSWMSLAADGVVPQRHKNLVVALQHVHDDHHPALWGDALVEVAEQFGLSSRVARLSDDFKRMCAIGHGCGLVTLGEAFTQCERHYDAMWNIDQANAALNDLAKEIEPLGADAKIIDVMGADWAAQEDAEMEAFMAKSLADCNGDPDEPVDIS